jgi:hypothetical protein
VNDISSKDALEECESLDDVEDEDDGSIVRSNDSSE